MKSSPACARFQQEGRGRPRPSPGRGRIQAAARRALAALRRTLGLSSSEYLYRCVLRGGALGRLLAASALTPPEATGLRIGLLSGEDFASLLPLLGRELAEGISTGRLRASGTMCLSVEPLPRRRGGGTRAAVTLGPIRMLHRLPAWSRPLPFSCPFFPCEKYSTMRGMRA